MGEEGDEWALRCVRMTSGCVQLIFNLWSNIQSVSGNDPGNKIKVIIKDQEDGKTIYRPGLGIHQNQSQTRPQARPSCILSISHHLPDNLKSHLL